MDLPSTIVFDYPSINHLTQRIMMLKAIIPRQSSTEVAVPPGSTADMSAWCDRSFLSFHVTSQSA